MTTAEFIKMLQEADPDGTAHVRMEGGVPYYAEHKAGYYDGPYEYIDENDRFVLTNLGDKVDIYCKNPADIIWDGHWTPWGSIRCCVGEIESEVRRRLRRVCQRGTEEREGRQFLQVEEGRVRQHDRKSGTFLGGASR